MHWYRLATLVFVVALSTEAALAANVPKVALHLDEQLVETVSGHTTMVAIGDRRLKAGDVIAYRITARNAGTAPALSLQPGGKIPVHTVFLKIVEAPAGSKPSFSLDGTTYSEHPTVTTTGKDGRRVTTPAPLDTYRAVRWSMSTPLQPKATAAFVYEVRVQ